MDRCRSKRQTTRATVGGKEESTNGQKRRRDAHNTITSRNCKSPLLTNAVGLEATMSGNQDKNDAGPTTLDEWKRACYKQEMRGNKYKEIAERQKRRIEELEKDNEELTILKPKVPLLEEKLATLKNAVTESIQLMVYDQKKEEAEILEEEEAEDKGQDDNEDGDSSSKHAGDGNNEEKKKKGRKERLNSLISNTLKNAAIVEGHILFRSFKYMNFATMAHQDVIRSIFSRADMTVEDDAVEMFRMVEPLKQYMGRRYADMKRGTKNNIMDAFMGKSGVGAIADGVVVATVANHVLLALLSTTEKR